MSANEYEIMRAIRTLEDAGYFVGRPDTKELPVKLEVEPFGGDRGLFDGGIDIKTVMSFDGMDAYASKRVMLNELWQAPGILDYVLRDVTRNLAHILADHMEAPVSKQLHDRIGWATARSSETPIEFATRIARALHNPARKMPGKGEPS